MPLVFLETRVLEQMRERPGMYFLPPLFPALCNYLHGCLDTLSEVAPQHPLCLELAGFDDWVCAHYKISLPSFRWRQAIWERASDDKEQVRLFVDLYLAYRRERGEQPTATTTKA